MSKMRLRNSERSYGIIAQAFHWGVALLVFGQANAAQVDRADLGWCVKTFDSLA